MCPSCVLRPCVPCESLGRTGKSAAPVVHDTRRHGRRRRASSLSSGSRSACRRQLSHAACVAGVENEREREREREESRRTMNAPRVEREAESEAISGRERDCQMMRGEGARVDGIPLSLHSSCHLLHANERSARHQQQQQQPLQQHRRSYTGTLLLSTSLSLSALPASFDRE